MSGGPRFPLAVAVPLAVQIKNTLKPYCERIEIAGSLRRSAPDVGDIEIVLVPKFDGLRNLFGDVDSRRNLCWDALDRLVADGRFQAATRGGKRYRQHVDTGTGIPVDLFAVFPPATWGAILAIRTGPADFSRHLVTQARTRGHRIEGGAVYDKDGRGLPTDTEEDFFRACAVDWIEPHLRRQTTGGGS